MPRLIRCFRMSSRNGYRATCCFRFGCLFHFELNTNPKESKRYVSLRTHGSKKNRQFRPFVMTYGSSCWIGKGMINMINMNMYMIYIDQNYLNSSYLMTRKQDQQIKLLDQILDKVQPTLRKDCNYR